MNPHEKKLKLSHGNVSKSDELNRGQVEYLGIEREKHYQILLENTASIGARKFKAEKLASV